ncbi:Uma2 family endonuclease [Aeromicrobium sp. Leaf350]|uniref:Uma2 family endonuclease n=1 Tax=Aeromicrobium sp. Leaf350 TaxID=2876565 RepID=UPI001E4AD462|nr:Uma2 family endonuclease [Aeromicrobium sp. Leaf350]
MSVLGFDSWQRYTVDDMPDYEGKLELVDGRLEVSPPAQWRHGRIAATLTKLLDGHLGDEYFPGAELGVRFDTRNFRQPDVLVTRRDVDPAGKWLAPTDVLLAVEVVSESSLTVDRITKPAQYARAGIGAFWRVETDPSLSLTAYVLDAGTDVYIELGTWQAGETVTVDRPFAVVFDLDTLDA